MLGKPRRTPAIAGLLAALLLSAPSAGPASAADCGNTSEGFKALTDLKTGTYQGRQGGLYPGGSNTRPYAHTAAGLALAKERVAPRKASGAVDESNGKLVFLSVGMSNAEREFEVFVDRAASDQKKSKRVVVVNGAQAGQEASEAAVEGRRYWKVVDERLAAAGVTAAQVGAMWLKQADGSPNLPFEQHVDQLEENLAKIVQIAKDRFPNLWVVYVSSRTYGGYATSDVSPEPWAYQEGFAAKGLIERQLTGSLPVGTAPWLSWGPYLWSDGTKGRSDGLKWFCSDFADDGVHPSKAGSTKVAGLLLDFLHTDATAKAWYTGSSSGSGGSGGSGGGSGGTPTPPGSASPTPDESFSASPSPSASATNGPIAGPPAASTGSFPWSVLLLALALPIAFVAYRLLRKQPLWPRRGHPPSV